MALKQYREAAHTASVIAREEQNSGQLQSNVVIVTLPIALPYIACT